jgi:hypothetical protein
MSNAAGAIISCLGSVIGNTGIQVQKGAHKALELVPEAQRKHYIYDCRWWVGLSMVIIGAIGDFIALGLAEQALVTAVGGATTLTANVLLSKFYNHEKIYNLDLAGVFLIILGAIIIAALVPSESEDQTLVTLLAYSTAPSFCLYMFVLSLTVICLLASVADSYMYRMRSKATGGVLVPITRRLRKLEEGEETRTGREHELELRLQEMEIYVAKLCSYLHDKQSRERSNARRCGYAPEEIDTPLLELAKTPSQRMDARVRRDSFVRELEVMGEKQKEEESYRHWKDAYIYAACSGAIGSVSVLLGGLTSKCLLMAFNGNNEWDEAYPYLFLCGMLTTVILQTKYLNSALELADVMTVFPTFQAVWIGFGVMGGIIFYQQADMGTGVWVGISIASFLMVVGCVFLMLHGKKDFQDKLTKKMEEMMTDTKSKSEGVRRRISALGMSNMLAIGRNSGVDHEGHKTHSRNSKDGGMPHGEPNAETPLSEGESEDTRDDDTEYEQRMRASERRKRIKASERSNKGRGRRHSKGIRKQQHERGMHDGSRDFDSDSSSASSSASASGISVWQHTERGSRSIRQSKLAVKHPERIDIAVHGAEDEDGSEYDGSASDAAYATGYSSHRESQRGRGTADSADIMDLSQSDLVQLEIMNDDSGQAAHSSGGPAPPSNTCATGPTTPGFDHLPTPTHSNSAPGASFSSRVFSGMRGGRTSPPDAIAVHPSFSPAAAAKPPMQHDALDIGLDRTVGEQEQTREDLQAELARYAPTGEDDTNISGKTRSRRGEHTSSRELQLAQAQPVVASHMCSQLEAHVQHDTRPEDNSPRGHARASTEGALPVGGGSALSLSLRTVGTHTYEVKHQEKENDKKEANPKQAMVVNQQLLLEKPANLRSQSDSTIRSTHIFEGLPVAAASALPRQSSRLAMDLPVEESHEGSHKGSKSTGKKKKKKKKPSEPNTTGNIINPFEVPKTFELPGKEEDEVDNNPFDVYSSRGSPLASLNQKYEDGAHPPTQHPHAPVPQNYQRKGPMSANPSFGSTDAVPYFASPSPNEGVMESATMEFGSKSSSKKSSKDKGSKVGKGGASKGGKGKSQRRRSSSRDPNKRSTVGVADALPIAGSPFHMEGDGSVPALGALVSPFKGDPPLPPSGSPTTSPGRKIDHQVTKAKTSNGDPAADDDAKRVI